MNASAKPRPAILAGYQLGLYLYPADSGESYGRELNRWAKDMQTESASPRRTAFLLTEDLLRSLFKEYFGMSLNRVPQLVILLTLTTFIAGTAANISHQVLRMSANDPQIQMAEDAAQQLNAGEDVAHILRDRKVDIAASLAPFVIVYDNAAQPVASSATLDGATPTPPRGVLEYVRSTAKSGLPGSRGLESALPRWLSGLRTDLWWRDTTFVKSRFVKATPSSLRPGAGLQPILRSRQSGC